MELDKFVAETLIAISRGVERAQQDATQNADINPSSHGSAASKVMVVRESGKRIQSIEFDVALTVEDTAEGEGKITVFGSNIGGGKVNKETLTSRVSFSVPMAFK
ncbi:hypothetical protein BCS96_11445 [Vibrio breoganii]|uniref:hypothetical protein n=1 Tax=Vibrio breoganii TaxID=553239 RepID=UPI000C825A12|nr:hypothetical protein [Vibrio breoganii]PMG31202.1 hypothetical protein BCU93_07385 [Vibrio breoganii]PMG90237.1 hypothetical protein BCU81_06865 [Vibrio breoganii]PML84850.1 hypothetical protein BCT68_00555 [Vibrio breoganii]PMM44962.1 hypothetical protein BCT52_09965 [Vibrio breoganii]PMO92319.1 hypothetical protein BCS98_10060 [Vibrio breoganii]